MIIMAIHKGLLLFPISPLVSARGKNLDEDGLALLGKCEVIIPMSRC
jgi:hypothetical protein